jgi:hypothetical protein
MPKHMPKKHAQKTCPKQNQNSQTGTGLPAIAPWKEAAKRDSTARGPVPFFIGFLSVLVESGLTSRKRWIRAHHPDSDYF